MNMTYLTNNFQCKNACLVTETYKIQVRKTQNYPKKVKNMLV